MKKIVKLSLIFISLISIMFIVGNVYAALSCNISLETVKTEFSKDEEFIIDVKLSNIKSDMGIISLGATLEYDKNSLTLLEMQGKNDWDTPIEKISYNPENGKLVLAKGGLAKNDETVFTMKFKVKETSKTETNVTLKNITVADGTEPANVNVATKKFMLKKGTQEDTQKPEQNNTTNNTTTTDTNNSLNTNSSINSLNKIEDNTTKSEVLPKTGTKSIMLIIFIGIVIISIVISYINYKKMKF